MENTIKSIMIFAIGASAGAIVTWKLIKDKYKKIAQEEIDSVKEVYFTKKAENKNPSVDNKAIKDYSKLTADLGYTSTETKKEVKEEKPLNKPYIISPDEFGENEYDIVSLNYYADGVLADDFDVIIDDVESTVGTDSLTHFGEYEDDSVFVRNDELKIDYEILRDTRKFEEVANKRLYPGDDE